MIVVKLAGGLGNQMFQYAFGRSLSILNRTDLKLDLSFLQNRNMGDSFVYRNYELDLFKINEKFNTEIFSGIGVNEPHFHFSQKLIDQIKNNSNNFYLDGYWQSPFYFQEIEKLIREEFVFKNPIQENDTMMYEMLASILESNSVMINVRRTDYLNNNFHGVMDIDYIMNSVEMIKSKVDNPKFFIFSDDIEWCISNLNIDDMIIVDHKFSGDRFSHYLELMSKCKHFIIPNSTFAWWAAWLNNNDEKIVISPKRWFTDEYINTNDLIPDTWIRI